MTMTAREMRDPQETQAKDAAGALLIARLHRLMIAGYYIEIPNEFDGSLYLVHGSNPRGFRYKGRPGRMTFYPHGLMVVDTQIAGDPRQIWWDDDREFRQFVAEVVPATPIQLMLVALRQTFNNLVAVAFLACIVVPAWLVTAWFLRLIF